LTEWISVNENVKIKITPENSTSLNALKCRPVINTNEMPLKFIQA
jgi:hypothetical protein